MISVVRPHAIPGEAFDAVVTEWHTQVDKVVRFLLGVEVVSDECDAGLRTLERTLVPKYARDVPLRETVVHQLKERIVTFTPQYEEETEYKYYPTVEMYSIAYRQKELVFEAKLLPGAHADKIQEIGDRLLKRLHSWAKNAMKPGGYTPMDVVDHIVTRDAFRAVYDRLKPKYRPWVQRWADMAPTDATKFVFEDIAIVAYIQCLWDMFPAIKALAAEREYDMVDLGCGNGFLVYLLHQEGFRVYGIDVHERPTWTVFQNGTDVDLRHAPVRADEAMFSDVALLLGNHSDELTPWVPLFAYRSQCHFWLLPCCFYTFDAKFTIGSNIRGEGRYAKYLDYIAHLIRTCGFEVRRDGMRIPSTKNRCFVGLLPPSFDPSVAPAVDALLHNVRFLPRRAPNEH